MDNISFTTEYILSKDESRILSSQNGRSFNSDSISDVSSNVISFTSPTSGYSKIKIKRDTYSEIYGSSDTVTPESHDWIVCVVAFGTATNVGSVDVANVMSVVGQVQADISNIESSFNTNVVRAGMPNWNASVSVPIQKGYSYNAPSDGFLLFSVKKGLNGGNVELVISISGIEYNFTSPFSQGTDFKHSTFALIPMAKGTTCEIVAVFAMLAYFLPAYGV